MKARTRLAKLERVLRVPDSQPPSIMVFWHDERVACEEHARCDIEVATGEHHQGVIHLRFSDRGSVR